jgi:hypothetical protein
MAAMLLFQFLSEAQQIWRENLSVISAVAPCLHPFINENRADFSAGAVRMTALIYCQFQCACGKFPQDFSAGALKMTVNLCCHSQSSRGNVPFEKFKAL